MAASWISDWNNFSFLSSTSYPKASYPGSSQLAFWFRRRSEKQIFKMAALWGGGELSWISNHNDFIFLCTSHSDASDQVNWHFDSGEEAKKRFSRWLPWWPSWNSNWKDFSYFWSTSHMMNPTKFQVSWPFDSGEANGDHLGFPIGTILAIFDL